jgi:hypothetical protein
MQWGIRLFLVLVTLGIAGIVVLAVGVIVRPVVREARRSRAAGNWWLPFLPDAAGGYGPLADNHWWSVMRAPRAGSAAGLAIRWGFWVLMSALLSVAMIYLLVGWLRLLGTTWS